ncbi:hypothetical protein ABEF95_013894 [Exophiala dermatitidis]
MTGSPVKKTKHYRPDESSSSTVFSRTRTKSSSKLSWSLLKTKLSDSKRTLTGVGVDREHYHPSSSKLQWKSDSAYPSPTKTKTRLKVSPPITIPERPEPLLLEHPLLDFSETGQSQNTPPAGTYVVGDDTAEFAGSCSDKERALSLADLDADKRGNEFERIHRGGWTRVLPREWVEEEFSDDDSKDTELTRSVYSQDNGEEESRRDMNDHAVRERWQIQLSQDSDSNFRSDAGAGRLNDLVLFGKGNASKTNGSILATRSHDGASPEPLRKSARNPFQRKDVPTTLSMPDVEKHKAREGEACESSGRIIRDHLTENDTQRGPSGKHSPYQPVAWTTEDVSERVLTAGQAPSHRYAGHDESSCLYTGKHAEQASTTLTHDQRGHEHSYYPRHTQEPLIPAPLRIKRHREADHAEKRPSKQTEPNVPEISPGHHQVTRAFSHTSSPDEISEASESWQQAHYDASRHEAKREQHFYLPPKTNAPSPAPYAQSLQSPQSSWTSVLVPSDSDGGRRPDQRSSNTRRNVRAATQEGRNLDFDDAHRRRASETGFKQLDITEPAAGVSFNSARRVIEQFHNEQSQRHTEDVDCPGRRNQYRIEHRRHHHSPRHSHGAVASLTLADYEGVSGDGDGDGGDDGLEHPLVTDIDDILDMYLPQNHLEQGDRYRHGPQNQNQNQVLKSDPVPQPKPVRRDRRNEHHHLQPQLQDEQGIVLSPSRPLPGHITTKDQESQALPTTALSSNQIAQPATSANTTYPYPLSLRYRPPLASSKDAHARPKRNTVAENCNYASPSDCFSASNTVVGRKSPGSKGWRSGDRGSLSHFASISGSASSPASRIDEPQVPTFPPGSQGAGKLVPRRKLRNGNINEYTHDDEGRHSDGTAVLMYSAPKSELATETGTAPSPVVGYGGRHMVGPMRVRAPVSVLGSAIAHKMVPVTILDSQMGWKLLDAFFSNGRAQISMVQIGGSTYMRPMSSSG